MAFRPSGAISRRACWPPPAPAGWRSGSRRAGSIIDLLLRAGADPNKKTEDGDTALTWLALNADNVAAAERLIAAGADPCAIPRYASRAKPAADLAEERGHHALAKFMAAKSTGC